jgi:MFS superfamily sulfate permease-like transporter
MKTPWPDYRHDLVSSIVGFLVAVPLSLGIALASGVPPALGLVSTIVGCLIVGCFTGATLMITGPAAGMIAVTLACVHQYGLASLGMVVLLSGLIQILAGVLKIGQLFRTITPAVIHGLMAGIGLIIVLGQFHTMFDIKPAGEGVANFLKIPGTLASALPSPDPSAHTFAIGIALLTILVILVHQVFPKMLKALPASLYAIGTGMIVANLMHLPIQYVALPKTFVENLHFIQPGELGMILNPTVLLAAFSMAFIASAKALLTANAVEQMHDYERTKNNKEMIAQGIGNVLTGLVGGIPISGEILRSTANVQAGARTRVSLVLIGLWVLLFVLLFPQFLHLIPLSSLAGMLVYTGITLISPHHMKTLLGYGKRELAIYFITALAVVFIDPLEGVLIGMILGLIELTMDLSKLHINMIQEPGVLELRLEGHASFINLPTLVSILENIEPGVDVQIRIDNLRFIDNACFEALKSWHKGYSNTGGSVTIEWHALQSRISRKHAHQPADQREKSHAAV